MRSAALILKVGSHKKFLLSSLYVYFRVKVLYLMNSRDSLRFLSCLNLFIPCLCTLAKEFFTFSNIN